MAQRETTVLDGNGRRCYEYTLQECMLGASWFNNWTTLFGFLVHGLGEVKTTNGRADSNYEQKHILLTDQK